jgi:hypothetical protein
LAERRLGARVEVAEGVGQGFGELVDVAAGEREGRIFRVLPCGPVALISTRRSRRPLTTASAASPRAGRGDTVVGVGGDDYALGAGAQARDAQCEVDRPTAGAGEHDVAEFGR